MSHPIVLSDDEEQQNASYLSPLPNKPKKRRITEQNHPTSLLIIDDDPTPRKPGSESTPFFVPETPMSDGVSILKCTTTTRISSNPKSRVSLSSDDPKLSGISSLICLESDNESEGVAKRKNEEENEALLDFESDEESVPELISRLPNPGTSLGTLNLAQIRGESSSHSIFSEDFIHQGILKQFNMSKVTSCTVGHNSGMNLSHWANVHPVLQLARLLRLMARYDSDEGNVGLEQMGDVFKQKGATGVNAEKKRGTVEAVGKRKNTKEERTRLMEENKLKKEQEKLRKEALKAEAAEIKKLEKEKQKWEKGKFAVKSIVAEIDAKVVELGSVGGHLLSGFAEKGLTYRITSNPVGGSIVWTMTVPEQISQLFPKGIEIPYVLFVYEAEEFCNLVKKETLMDHVSSVRSRYPSHTICYATNRLMAYIHKREQGQYKNPTSSNGWRRPPVEEVLSKMTTHFHRVHSRLCVDEAELAEHVVGLTSSLASCQFRKKLTRLSVNANGSMVSKDSVDKKIIKRNTWLKALVAIPKVQPRFAMAIWKKYPTMKSLLSVYMDPSKSVHQKEFLLKDLMTEGLLGVEDRRLGEVCSKRVYRILMAQSGSIKTDDVEDGADFFRSETL